VGSELRSRASIVMHGAEGRENSESALHNTTPSFTNPDHSRFPSRIVHFSYAMDLLDTTPHALSIHSFPVDRVPFCSILFLPFPGVSRETTHILKRSPSLCNMGIHTRHMSLAPVPSTFPQDVPTPWSIFGIGQDPRSPHNAGRPKKPEKTYKKGMKFVSEH
jgi:hypothetical protein